ncbi:hypothetical protein WDZ92_06410 [Nostoc sp. NIES-2111]
MADKSMGRIFFPLYRETDGDATRKQDDPYGVFSCILPTARFLDIEEKAFKGVILVKRKAGARALVRADGTKLTQGEATNEVVETLIAKQLKAGTRSISLKTGKRIYPTDPKKLQVHTLTFSFPSWATIPVIADALGELIPTTKIKETPTATDIQPYFWLKGGGRYAIMRQAAAIANADATVASATLKQKIAAKGGKVIK